MESSQLGEPGPNPKRSEDRAGTAEFSIFGVKLTLLYGAREIPAGLMFYVGHVTEEGAGLRACQNSKQKVKHETVFLFIGR